MSTSFGNAVTSSALFPAILWGFRFAGSWYCVHIGHRQSVSCLSLFHEANCVIISK